MTTMQKGLVLAALECAMVLSLTGKLLYDRSTRPRVWVRTAPYDPNLPIRGRYLSLALAPEKGASWRERLEGQRVLFFVPEKTQGFEVGRRGGELWAEVTIPKAGPPRPIRLAMKKDGRFEVIEER
jgi:hypothetical protein